MLQLFLRGDEYASSQGPVLANRKAQEMGIDVSNSILVRINMGGFASEHGTPIVGSLLKNGELETPVVEAHASTSSDSPSAK